MLCFVITVYLFLQFFPFSFHTLILWLYPKAFGEVDRPKAGDVKEFTFIWHHCFHQSILTYCRFVLSRTTPLLFESNRSVQNALWKSAGAGHHQLLTPALERAGWCRNSLEERDTANHLRGSIWPPRWVEPHGSFPIIYNVDLSTRGWSNTSLFSSPGNSFQTVIFLPHLLF